MKRIATLAAVIALAVAAAAFAQDRPNFAGKWTLDTAAAGAPAGAASEGRGRGRGGFGLGQELTIEQDATTLTLDYVGGGRNPGPVSMSYTLDGSDSVNTGMGGMEQTSKAMWEGETLVVTTTFDFGGGSFEQRRVFSLEGGNLVIESTNPGRGGGAPTTTKQVYTKAS